MLDSKFITVPNVDTLNKISISNKSIVFITGTGQVYTHGKYFPNTDSLSALDVATKTWVGNNYLPLSGGTLSGDLSFQKSQPKLLFYDTADTSQTGQIEFAVLNSSLPEVGIGWLIGPTATAMNYETVSLTVFGDMYSGGTSISTVSKVLNANNYTSYAPKLDGTGATGTWPIGLQCNDGVGIKFLGQNNSSSVYGDIRYTATSISGYTMHTTQAKALYIQSNGYESPSDSDSGGIDIDNDGATIFGAGDSGSILRVINEDSVSYGSMFLVSKGGSGYFSGSLSVGAQQLDYTGARLYVKGHARADRFFALSGGWNFLDGQKLWNGGALNVDDGTISDSYYPWVRQTNTASSKYFSMGVRDNRLYIIGSSTSRTENGYDYGWYFDVSNGIAYGNYDHANTATTATTATEASKVSFLGTYNAESNRNTLSSGVYTYNIGSSNSGAPASEQWSVLAFGNGTGGSVELCGNWTNTYGLYWRSLRDVTDSWFSWKEILDSTTYSKYALPLTGGTLTGTLTATAFYESSDIRMKSNIMDIINSDRASEIQLKQFNFNNETKTKYGVIAQDLIALGFNDLVSQRDDGMYSVDYTSLLVLKIQMLEKKVKQLEQKLNEQ